MNQPNGEAPQSVPPHGLISPIPLHAEVGDATAPDGTRFVLMRIESALGSAMYLMPPDMAGGLGKLLVDKAAQTPPSGLIIPAMAMPNGFPG